MLDKIFQKTPSFHIFGSVCDILGSFAFYMVQIYNETSSYPAHGNYFGTVCRQSERFFHPSFIFHEHLVHTAPLVNVLQAMGHKFAQRRRGFDQNIHEKLLEGEHQRMLTTKMFYFLQNVYFQF